MTAHERHPPPCRQRRLSRVLLAAFLAAGAVRGHALPTGAEISAGGGVISRSGGALTIQQTSPRLAINWQSFGIGAQESVAFQQPDANAIALNRVLGQDPSVILGSLSANGQVFVLNPNGVLFGPGAQVDVGGIVASTLGLSDSDFLAGRYTFAHGGSAGSVVNRGTIRAREGGYVALLAPQVANEGVIAARLGTVALGAGNQVTLHLAGNALVGFSVDQAAVDALATNKHLMQADGGTVLLSARAKDALLATVVNNEGIVEARSVSVENGVIRLEGGESGVVSVSGKLDVSGTHAGETGGSVTITGDKVGLASGAVVDASGHAGGGTVRVGGDYQGRNPGVRNAGRSYVAPQASITADATDKGDGGKVIVWADGATHYHGSISAKGGADSGDGGFVEVSGKQSLVFAGGVDTSAANGAFGTLLLDPTNITVVAGATPNPPNAADGTWAYAEDPGNQNIGAGAINALLTANNLTLQATNNITVSSAIAYSGVADRTLTLEADNDVTVSQTISSSLGRLGVVLSADADGSGVGNVAINNSITTRGGGLTASGQNVTANNTGTISTAGTGGRAGGDVTLAANAAGAVTIGKAITTVGGAAPAASNGFAGGDVWATGGTVTVANVTTAGSAGTGGGARAGGEAGSITLDATGTTPTITLNGNLDARGGNGAGGGTGGAGGPVTALDALRLSGNRSVLTSGGSGGTSPGGAVQVGDVDSSVATQRRGLTVTAGNATVALGSLGAVNPLGTVNVSGVGIDAGSIGTVGLANGNGASVTLNAGSGALTVGAIDTSGGDRTSNGAGRSGGAVTLTGHATAAGPITTRGSNGRGGNNVGGNGGTVTLNGAGTASSILLTGAIDTRGGDSVGTGNSGNGGGVTLRATDGGSIGSTATGTIDTSGGRGQAGGNVLVDRQAAGQVVGAVDLAGAITTRGGNGGTNGAGRNAGSVTLSNARTISVGAITARGGNSGGGNAVGGNGGSVAVTRAGTASTMAFQGVIDTRGGDSSGTGNTGNGGGVTIDGGTAPDVGDATFAAAAGIDTRGGRGQSGGTVTLRDFANIAMTGASVDTSGGAAPANSGTTGQGKNAGAIAVTGTGAVATGVLTALGGGAVAGSGKAGGSGGAVTITGGGVAVEGSIATAGGTGDGTGAAGAGGAVTLNGGAGGGVSQAAASTVNAGSATITVDGNDGAINLAGLLTTTNGGTAAVLIRDAATTALGNIDAASGRVVLGQGGANNLSGDVTQQAGSAITAASLAAVGGGTVSLSNANQIGTLVASSAAGGFTLDNGNNALIVAGNLTTTNSPVALRTGTGTYTQNNNVDINAGAGGITLTTDQIAIGTNSGSNALTTSGTLTLQPASPGQPMRIGGAAGADTPGTFDLRAVEIAAIATGATGSMVIGDAAAATGPLTVSGAVNLGGKTLTFNAGSIDDGAATGRTITAANLGLNARAAGIGSGAANGAIDVAVTNLAVTTADQSAYVSATGDVNLGMGSSNLGAGGLHLTSSGAITQSGTITATGASTFAADAASDITLTNPGNDFGTVAITSGSKVNIVDADALELGASSVARLTARTLSGDLTLGGNVSATAGGDSIVMSAAANFQNPGGHTLVPDTGRWLVYSSDPAPATDLGGLVPSFKRYHCTLAAGCLTPGTTVPVAGNGLLYSIAPTLDVTANDVSIVYGAAPSPLTYLATGFVDGDTTASAVTGTLARIPGATSGSGNEVVGTSAITQGTLTSPLGYQIAYTGASYAIAPRALTASLVGTVTRQYDATTAATLTPGNYALPGVTAGDAVALSGPLAGAYDNANVGTGKTVSAVGLSLLGADAGNYAIHAEASGPVGTITAASLTYTANAAARDYGDPNPPFSGTVTGFVGGDTLASATSGSLAFASPAPALSNVGSYTIEGSGLSANNGNYIFSQNPANATALTITRRPVTLTAGSASREYGAPNPAVDVTANPDGLAPFDTLASAFPALAASSGATATTTVGVYDSGPNAYGVAGAANGNYAVTTAAGRLTVTPATLVYWADPVTRPYGQPNPAFTGTVTGFRNGETIGSATTGILTFGTTATQGSSAGTYPIDGSGLAANFGNYVFAQALSNATALTIEPRGDPTSPVVNPAGYAAALASAAQNESTCALLQAGTRAETLCGAQQNFRSSEQLNLVPGWRRVIDLRSVSLTVEGEGVRTP